MRRIDIGELGDQLDECLRAAATDEIVLVTERGRALAEIRPPREVSELDREQAALHPN